MRKVIFLFFILLLIGCSTQKIADIKNDEYVEKSVTVSGIVGVSMKIGPISGFIIKDETDTIPVKAFNLPKEGETIKVKGILKKDLIIGYYIQMD